MLKSLFPDLPWSRIEAVGFDLDGTLYDERHFIEQVYRPLANIIAQAAGTNEQSEIYAWMLNRWIEKGSSYPKIYSEAIRRFAPNAAEDDVVAECLNVFRGFQPELFLADSIAVILDEVKNNWIPFLVTDGQSGLQRAKMKSLGLDRWFAPEDISISGDHGKHFEKPSMRIIDNLQCFKANLRSENIIYFGDREVDRQFADQCGFLFRRVKLMKGVNE